jgi:hypothetical protein
MDAPRPVGAAYWASGSSMLTTSRQSAHRDLGSPLPQGRSGKVSMNRLDPQAGLMLVLSMACHSPAGSSLATCACPLPGSAPPVSPVVDSSEPTIHLAIPAGYASYSDAATVAAQR